MKAKQKKRGQFDVLQYQTRVEAEESWIRDGMYEMMHEVAYC